MTTTAQRWAQTRNWQKVRILSAQSACYSSIFTEQEHEVLKQITSLFDSILLNWKSQNKESKQYFIKNF
jgi:hypothetical protein